MKAPIITVKDSGTSGPHVVIMTGVHGNEKVGPSVIDSLIAGTAPQLGKVTFIVANPSALEQNERYINIKLNRRFGLGLGEYPEDSLAESICKVLDAADGLLDIHSYNEPMDNPFIITDGPGVEVAKRLPATFLNTGWLEHSSGSSDEYMSARDKVGICFECGSSERPEQYTDLAIEAARVFLAHFGIVEHAEGIVNQQHIEVQQIVKQQAQKIEFDKAYATFDALVAGDVFARVGEHEYRAPEDAYILFPRPNAREGDECFVLGVLKR